MFRFVELYDAIDCVADDDPGSDVTLKMITIYQFYHTARRLLLSDFLGAVGAET